MLEYSDSLSLPSEPPHIGNWFSSYVHESPVLSSIDELECEPGEEKTSEEEKLVKSRAFGREICLPSGENTAPNEDKCAVEFLRSSEYPELSNEPSDVNDSFSSYVPETPMSDEDGDLSIPGSNKINDLKDHGNSRGFSYESIKGKAESLSEDIRQGATDGWLSKGFVRCNASVEANCANQVIRSSDYLSPSPEPPDINDCLDSYVPETQEFDASNDSRAPESNDNELNDHDGQRWSSSSLGKEEKDVKCTRNGTKEKNAVQLLEGLAKFTSKENYKNASQNSPSTDDIALSSEPPDIKNWFSSYAYESPTLDSSDGFSILKYEESEFDIEERSRAGQRKLQNLGSTKAVLFANDNYQPSPKRFSQENTDKKRKQILDHNSTEDFVTSLDGKSSAEKLDKTLPEEDGLRLSNTNIPSPNKHETPSLIQRWDSAEHNLVLSKDSMKTTDSLNTSTVTRQSSQMALGGSICKENDRNGSADNGFISTRKIRSRKLHDENSLVKPGGVDWSASLRNETKYKPTYDKDTAARRVLLDTTNIQQSQPADGSQITGKWKCPQKRKPHLGPPLKQLRLEQWIRRV
ncbi:PREDICTED: uncharacterized protein LOC109185182 [Ipomoea nil]|uniref:uncharacterized protein LOC109185182 n=1 Tax=Ipomoea nil TaxID=35883 RepID=UPI0009015219|nr:PREDICTED: uncharacterized protein LOC109185182 [Ipomoea nil]XP_019190711.1 PREDICTED: uncharacterized protein LOC109185182 [Ipomoea nil]